MLLWQLIFFLAPLLFLVALSFWTVQLPHGGGLNPTIGRGMLGRPVFWEAYFRDAAAFDSRRDRDERPRLPASYAIAFKLPTPRVAGRSS